MFIVSKRQEAIINMNLTNEIFVTEKNVIKAKLSDGNNIPIAEYSSEQECITAIKMLVDYVSIKSEGVFYMPGNNEVKAHIIHTKDQWNHTKGKKTKGYGGS